MTCFKMNLVLVLAAGLSLSEGQKADEKNEVNEVQEKEPISYNTSQILLQVSDPIELSIWEGNTLFGMALLPKDGHATG